MTTENGGQKGYVLHGIREELLEQLEMRNWSKNDLSRFSGLQLCDISGIIKGAIAVTHQTAEALTRALGKTVDYWIAAGNYRGERQ